MQKRIYNSIQIGVPDGADRGTKFVIKRSICPQYIGLSDPNKATLGTRLRYLRKRCGFTITTFATLTRLSHNTIAKLERDEIKSIQPWILGRMLPLLSTRFTEAFPNVPTDIYDYLIPPNTFGMWLKNLRMRQGLKQKDLAKRIGVARFTVQRYERDEYMPNSVIVELIKKKVIRSSSETVSLDFKLLHRFLTRS